jgi:hypothetical protein
MACVNINGVVSAVGSLSAGSFNTLRHFCYRGQFIGLLFKE